MTDDAEEPGVTRLALTCIQDWGETGSNGSTRRMKEIHSENKLKLKSTGLPGWEWQSGDLVTGQEGEPQPHTRPLPQCGEY